jgi:hypothetical protein
MSVARVFPMILFAALVACSSPTIRQQAATSGSEDARFWGRMGAISAADRQSILAIASERLASSAPTCRIQSVKVFSDREVRVFFAPDPETSPGEMGLERRGRQWQITDEQPPAA